MKAAASSSKRAVWHVDRCLLCFGAEQSDTETVGIAGVLLVDGLSDLLVAAPGSLTIVPEAVCSRGPGDHSSTITA